MQVALPRRAVWRTQSYILRASGALRGRLSGSVLLQDVPAKRRDAAAAETLLEVREDIDPFSRVYRMKSCCNRYRVDAPPQSCH